jgi:twitching motility protein PilI
VDSQPLQNLRDRPLELLQELERRARAATAAPGVDADQGNEWTGVAVRLAGEPWLLARDEVREVLSLPGSMTRVPGARAWVLGIANIRGQVLPIIDLRHFLGAGSSPTNRNARLVVVNHREIPAALLVDEVQGFRRFAESLFSREVPPTALAARPWIAGSFRTGADVWPVMGLRRLVEDPALSGSNA